MAYKIEKAAVIGAGWMGTSIAAHLASSGIRTLLLDVLPPMQPTDEEARGGITRYSDSWRNKLSESALQRVFAQGAFLDPHAVRMVECGNMADHLHRLSEVDWVLEAVPEVLDVKQSLYRQIQKHVGDQTIVTSNTSGLLVGQLLSGCREAFARRFMVSHFFNPVRYMRLMELVPGADTDPDLVEFMSEFSVRRLGKGVVVAKDTPYFIANRIGLFSMITAIAHAEKFGICAIECDRLTGRAMARPKSATFRTADMVGLDALLLVFDNLHGSLAGDPWRENFNAPAFFRIMVGNRLWGEKTGSGFYRETLVDGQKTLQTIDYESLKYLDPRPRRFPSLEKAESLDTAEDRVRALISGECEGSEFAWAVLRDTLAYAAEQIGNIAEDPITFDRSMRWGYNWKLGPFEIWDSLGVEYVARRMSDDGIEVPESVQTLLDHGEGKWYTQEEGQSKQFFLPKLEMQNVPKPKGVISLSELRHSYGLVLHRGRYSLMDLGDGVGCLAIGMIKKNSPTIDSEFIDFLEETLNEADEIGFIGLVLMAERGDFNCGLELGEIASLIDNSDWSALESHTLRRQQLNQRIRGSLMPIISAIAWKTLGAGCEMAMHCSGIQAHAESHIGLNDMEAGLIPSGGGCKEVLYRVIDQVAADGPYPLAHLAFDAIWQAPVAKGVFEAMNLGLFRKTDMCTMSFERLLTDAKKSVKNLAATSFSKPQPTLMLPGRGGALALKLEMDQMRMAGTISDHDAKIGSRLARVLTGGDCSPTEPVSEDRLLELEREAFLSICGIPETRHRIESAITKKKSR